MKVAYKQQIVGEYKADYVIDGKVLLELKAISGLKALHEAQAIHYLAATGLRLAILMNFGGQRLEYKRIVK